MVSQTAIAASQLDEDKFIELLEPHTCVWNMKLTAYHINHQTELENMAKVMNTTGRANIINVLHGYVNR